MNLAEWLVRTARRTPNAPALLSGKNIVWKSNRGAPYIPSPLCFGGHYYLVDDEGFGTCFDAANGKELWRERIGGRSLP